jgi:hypothetical protein
VPRSGLTMDPVLEWRLAAQWRGYKWEEFAALEGEEMSVIVAEYRVKHQMEAVMAFEQAKAAERRARRRNKPKTAGP